MNYKVLYRKYRPKTFDEVIGQNNNIQLLKESIIDDKISHAYIFSGPRGTGKTSTAKIFAKAINCINNKDGNPCCKCQICLNNENADIYEIDAASNNGVDQIRELIENVKLSPIQSKYKVYIIDEVHMLSTSAFNALLLTLEEPPAHAVFILATTDIEEVPITVLSRCQRLDFKKISKADLISSIKNISKIEKINIDDEAISEIAEYSEGGLRDALSILDQLSKLNVKITEDIVLKSIGLISNDKLLKLFDAINENDINFIDNLVDEIKQNAIDYKSLIKKFINILKHKAIQIKEGVINTNLSFDNVKKLCFELSETLFKNNVNIDSYDLFELILLNYINKESNVSKPKIDVKEVPVKENLPKKVEQNYFPGNNLADIRINNCFVNASKDTLKLSKKNWETFIKELSNKKMKGLLSDTEIVLASNDIYVIKTEIDSSAILINDNLFAIQNEFEKKMNSKVKIVAASSDNWKQKTEEYKENIKNKKEYVYMEEPENTKTKEIVNDIFSNQKIEIV